MYMGMGTPKQPREEQVGSPCSFFTVKYGYFFPTHHPMRGTSSLIQGPKTLEGRGVKTFWQGMH